jgi:lipid A disaccharide synthetase
VNILANKELVPEFMPYFSSIDPIVEAIERLLSNGKKLSQLSGELIALAASAQLGNTSQKVAQIAVEMLGKTTAKRSGKPPRGRGEIGGVKL